MGHTDSSRPTEFADGRSLFVSLCCAALAAGRRSCCDSSRSRYGRGDGSNGESRVLLLLLRFVRMAKPIALADVLPLFHPLSLPLLLPGPTVL